MNLVSSTRPNPTSHTPAALPHAWEWRRFHDHEALSLAVAARVGAETRRQPEALIGLAAGASTRRAYELMAALTAIEPSLHARTRWIKLDEWGGLALDDPASCETFLRRTLLDPLAVPASRYCGWNSRPPDVNAECRRIEAWLAKHGPIDLQILGLGENGHLGFNEPGTEPQDGPHVAQLSATSLSHAMLAQARDRATFGLTLGLGDILRSRRIFLLVSGAHKARQLRRLALDGVSPAFPASVLHRHSAVTIFCDDAAAAQLPPEFSAAARPIDRTP